MKPILHSKTPRFLQRGQWILNPVGYMQTNFDRYGDIFQAPILPNSSAPLLFVNEPKAIQYMLTHDTGKELSAPGELNEVFVPLLGRQNVILLSGKQHRNRRQLVMPPLHGEHLHAYAQIIEQITQDVIAQWSIAEVLDVRAEMQKITLRVILQVVFGLHQGERYQQLERLLSLRLNITATPLAIAILTLFPWLQKDLGAWSLGARIRQLAEETDALLFAEIEDRRANPSADRIDILSLLLAAKDEEGNGLSNQDLRDELMTLLVAGHETTATALSWAMYWVHSLPQVKQTLLAELDTLTTPADVEQLLRLPYLSAVCNETLRIHPVAMLTFPRRVEIPLELCGHQLAPGAVLMGCIYLLHQRQDLYPQPQQFRPERFLERQFSPYEFMPFGGGVRRCVGAALAQYEMKIALGTILSRVELVLDNKSPVQPARRGLTLGQDAPIQVKKVAPRSPAPKPLSV
ncbi:cytochrome P450 [Cyanobacteria bacterium FACHB-63]|nr:cytochrome P450 [Cyanobacteria bacterium FACHB-63]